MCQGLPPITNARQNLRIYQDPQSCVSTTTAAFRRRQCGDEVFSNEPAVFVHALGVESTGRSGLLKRRQLTALGGRKESSASSMLLPSTLSQSDFACLEKFEYSDEEEENGVMVSGDHLSG